jgi:LPS-assembly lipoprotein
MKKILLVIVAALILNACGFKLATKADLAPMFAKTSVSYETDADVMANVVISQFKANDIQIVGAEEATADLTILYETKNKEILSVDEKGKVREYELILQVGIRLTDETGKALIKNQNIRLSRDFLFEIDDVLGKTSEREQIYQEMREDIARLIVYRLQAI